MNKELEESIKSMRRFVKSTQDMTAVTARDMQLVLKALDNSISKEKVKEIIKKIEKYEEIAREQIQQRIVVADSDSLNFGRKQAHGKDAEELKTLLNEK